MYDAIFCEPVSDACDADDDAVPADDRRRRDDGDRRQRCSLHGRSGRSYRGEDDDSGNNYCA